MDKQSSPKTWQVLLIIFAAIIIVTVAFFIDIFIGLVVTLVFVLGTLFTMFEASEAKAWDRYNG